MIALPCLLYGIESMNLSKTVLKSLEHPWSRVFMKIFSTFEASVISDCQYFSGYWPVEHLARCRKIKFMNSLMDSDNCVLNLMHQISAQRELAPIAAKYNVCQDFLTANYQTVINRYISACQC